MLQVRKRGPLLLERKQDEKRVFRLRLQFWNFHFFISLFLVSSCFHCCFSSKQSNLLSQLTRMFFPELSIMPHWFIPTTLMITTFKLHLLICRRHEALLRCCFFCLNCRWCGIEACFSQTVLQLTASLPITQSEICEASFPIWNTAQANASYSR